MSPLVFFFFTLFSTPFVIMAAMFVPVLGQLLALLNLGLTIALLRMRGSIAFAVSFILAVIAFFVILSSTGQFLGRRQDIPLFIFLALAIPYNFFYAFMVAREIYRLVNPNVPQQKAA